MERRYQVFISSTYADLTEERREVIQALLEMDCLPAGMEMFPAANEDQWSLIKQVIDESDYYVVIVGGRYGTMTTEGVSYTEKEYDYAVAQGKPVMGFVHASPESIALGKSQPEAQAQLEAFRAKVMSRMVKTYESAQELGSAVSRSMIKTMKANPAEGWVRGQFAVTPESQTQLADLRALVSELTLKLETSGLSKTAVPEGLASGTDVYVITGLLIFTKKSENSLPYYNRTNFQFEISLSATWNDLLRNLGPMLLGEATEFELRKIFVAFSETLAREIPPAGRPTDFGALIELRLTPTCFDDVMVQLFALGLITHGLQKRAISDRGKYWGLTREGQDAMMKLRAIYK